MRLTRNEGEGATKTTRLRKLADYFDAKMPAGGTLHAATLGSVTVRCCRSTRTDAFSCALGSGMLVDERATAREAIIEAARQTLERASRSPSPNERAWHTLAKALLDEEDAALKAEAATLEAEALAAVDALVGPGPEGRTPNDERRVQSSSTLLQAPNHARTSRNERRGTTAPRLTPDELERVHRYIEAVRHDDTLTGLLARYALGRNDPADLQPPTERDAAWHEARAREIRRVREGIPALRAWLTQGEWVHSGVTRCAVETWTKRVDADRYARADIPLGTYPMPDHDRRVAEVIDTLAQVSGEPREHVERMVMDAVRKPRTQVGP
jgi:hypothetical protein